MRTLINADHRQPNKLIDKFDCLFADPPDNINLGYDGYDDRLPIPEYRAWLRRMIWDFTELAPVVWLSYNSRWSSAVGRFVDEFLIANDEWADCHCVQVFTFGQYNDLFLGNNHRPLWLLYRKDAKFYPDSIRVQSWRKRNGDKRAAKKDRVPADVFDFEYTPAGTAFDFPRVTGNSKQRCDWHPTQLHKDMLARCINFCTLPGDKVFDPFAGTGTTLRVCGELARECVSTDIDRKYCEKIAGEVGLDETSPGIWTGSS